MVVTFCGHSDVADSQQVYRWLRLVIRQLVDEGGNIFYSGGYGGFDRLVANAIREEQKTAPHIQNILVLAYLRDAVYADGYDYTTYPELERVPKRFAISKRNEIMGAVQKTAQQSPKGFSYEESLGFYLVNRIL